MEFNQIIIFGNNVEGATLDTWKEAVKGLEKYGLESVYMGAPLGVSENRVIIIKGSMDGYAKMLSNPDWPLGKVISNTRSIVCLTP